MRRISLSLLTVLALTAPAWAQTAPAAAPAAATPPGPAANAGAASWLEGPLPADIGKIIDPRTLPALQNIVQAGTEIRYLGDEYGIKAYFMTNKGQGQVVYLTPDKQAVLVGTLFNGDGSAITFMQLLRLRRTGFDPTPFFDGSAANGSIQASESGSTQASSATPAATDAAAQSPGERLMRDASTASWIAYGPPTAPQLTVFMDPNCDHCHAFFKQLLPYTQQGKLYLRVVPITLVDPATSRKDMYAIMSSGNPAEAWTAAVNGTKPAAVASPSDKVVMAISNNDKLFTDWQLKVTPYSVYRAKSGEVKVLAAEPTDFNAFLGELGVTP